MAYDPVPLHETAATDAAASRRVWARYASSRPLPRFLTVADTHTLLEAWILDLSAGGVGLLVTEPQQTGLLLHIELETHPAALPLNLWAQVVHCQAVGAGEFRLGCRFTTDERYVIRSRPHFLERCEKVRGL